eukprot:Blabericola_migrator_1__11334@NODE_66_length_15680_cov_202_244988_g59_i0_p12_GENE_NODE_66_length_15680_cov_202_244988_g59_i0NODE_66_length_15680_cov_202_244988_g59_i0_p12_ORF_typecomplete_len116_score22_73FtsK_gamma/PF09397_10/0_2_NODE_66_length_15680_cov_202_244988_g59_i056726019
MCFVQTINAVLHKSGRAEKIFMAKTVFKVAPLPEVTEVVKKDVKKTTIEDRKKRKKLEKTKKIRRSGEIENNTRVLKGSPLPALVSSTVVAKAVSPIKSDKRVSTSLLQRKKGRK